MNLLPLPYCGFGIYSSLCQGSVRHGQVFFYLTVRALFFFTLEQKCSQHKLFLGDPFQPDEWWFVATHNINTVIAGDRWPDDSKDMILCNVFLRCSSADVPRVQCGYLLCITGTSCRFVSGKNL